MAGIVDRLGIERVLSVTLGAGALCILAIGLFDPPIGFFGALIFGAGIGVGAQGGINALSGLIYPPNIRATGAGWALGLGRIGGVAGPLLGGALIAHGFSARQIFLSAAVPAFCAMALMAVLGTRAQALGRVHGRDACPRNADETLGRSTAVLPRPFRADLTPSRRRRVAAICALPSSAPLNVP